MFYYNSHTLLSLLCALTDPLSLTFFPFYIINRAHLSEAKLDVRGNKKVLKHRLKDWVNRRQSAGKAKSSTSSNSETLSNGYCEESSEWVTTRARPKYVYNNEDHEKVTSREELQLHF